MKLIYFADVQNVKELKKAYHKLVLKNHPDKGGDHETMVAIVLEYEWAIKNLFDKDGNRLGGAKANGSTSHYNFEADGFREALDKLMQLDGLTIEVCGTWIWVGGNTLPNKDAIKAAGCRWAKAKKLWYWKDPETFCRSKGCSMDKIRELHGSEVFKSNGKKALTA